MLPYWTRCLAAGCAALLLGACSSTALRPAADSGEATSVNAPAPAAQPAPKKLPRAYDNALVLMQSGDYAAAIPVLQQFSERNPGLAGPWINLGIAFQRTGQTEAALAALQKAVELNPAGAAAWHQLGILHREQGRFDASLEAYGKALELDADYALAHRNVGILYDLYLQQPALALDHYRRYLELNTEPDKQVSGWVLDLERRTARAQARNAP